MAYSVCENCSYKIRITDTYWIPEHEVTHVICYGCGTEWVE